MIKMTLMISSLLASLFLSSCVNKQIADPADEYSKWAAVQGASHAFTMKPDDDERRSVLIIAFNGTAGCHEMYNQELLGSPIMVVFGSIDQEKFEENTNEWLENPILEQGDINRKNWSSRCEQMKTVRERHLGCKLQEGMKFEILMYYPSFFEGSNFREAWFAAKELVLLMPRKGGAVYSVGKNSELEEYCDGELDA